MGGYWPRVRDILISLALIVVGVTTVAHFISPWGHVGGSLLAVVGFTGLMVIYFDDPPDLRDDADARGMSMRTIWRVTSIVLFVSVISVHAIRDEAWRIVAVGVVIGVAVCWRLRMLPGLVR